MMLQAAESRRSVSGAEVAVQRAEVAVQRAEAAAQRAQVAQTRADLDAMVAMRGEIQAQLNTLSRQRNRVSEQMHVAPDAASRNALQGTLKEIDLRTARLQGEVLRLDDRITEGLGRGLFAQPAPSVRTTVQSVPRPVVVTGLDGEDMAALLVGEALAFVLIGFVAWRLGWKRMQARFAHLSDDNARQFQRIQDSVDVIAVEVERISEGQRFVAKALSAGAQPVVEARKSF